MKRRDPADYMGKRPDDPLTAQAWNGLVELVLNLSMRIALIEQQLEEGNSGTDDR